MKSPQFSSTVSRCDLITVACKGPGASEKLCVPAVRPRSVKPPPPPPPVQLTSSSLSSNAGGRGVMNKLRQSFRRKKDVYVPESSRPHQWQTDEEAVRSGKCNFQVKVNSKITSLCEGNRHKPSKASSFLKHFLLCKYPHFKSIAFEIYS